tara:strand:+ start:2547 stop:3650 length:1104 start_codon:yes stop_codon:yes gene_type:complete
MKINQFNQLIAEEVRTILKENNDREVLSGLDKLIQELPGAIPELEKVVTSNLLPYIASTLPESLEEVEGDDSPPMEKAAATAKGAASTAGYVLSHLPFGQKMGVMIATALDTTTADHVRNAVLFALGNLLAGQLGLDLPDLGDLIQEIPEELWSMLPFTDDEQEWDWGAINAMDDIALLTWAWLKVKNAVDVEEKLHEFGKFIGRSNLGKQPEPAGAGGFAGDDMSLDAKAARAGAMKEKGKKFRGIKEMKIKKSEIYNIIKEELEVILTNEEVEEVFNLDLSALLDEMMNEEEMRTAKGNVTQAARKKHATVGKDKFPIFDKKSAEAAIDLRGHAPEADRAKIINKAAKFAPEAAKKAREADKKKD